MESIQCKKCFNFNPPGEDICLRCGAGLGASNGRGFLPEQVYESRYQLLRRIGAGGMGEVWAATHLGLLNQVAVKFLHTNLMDHPTARSRALKEAQSLGQVAHRNVIAVMDCFEIDTTIGMVMPFLSAGSLADRIEAQGMLPAGEVVGLMRGILKGLGALHRQGLVHRDIKPENILLTQEDDEWVPKITDLGVAQRKDGTRITQDGSRLGTPEYMAPEQIKSGETTVFSDIYACGVMMYEMLTGALPFTGSDFEIQSGHVHEPPDLSKFPGGTPTWLRAVVAKAIEKMPTARFENAAAFHAALNADTQRRNERSPTHDQGEHATAKVSTESPFPSVTGGDSLHRCTCFGMSLTSIGVEIGGLYTTDDVPTEAEPLMVPYVQNVKALFREVFGAEDERTQSVSSTLEVKKPLRLLCALAGTDPFQCLDKNDVRGSGLRTYVSHTHGGVFDMQDYFEATFRYAAGQLTDRVQGERDHFKFVLALPDYLPEEAFSMVRYVTDSCDLQTDSCQSTSASISTLNVQRISPMSQLLGAYTSNKFVEHFVGLSLELSDDGCVATIFEGDGDDVFEVIASSFACVKGGIAASTQWYGLLRETMRHVVSCAPCDVSEIHRVFARSVGHEHCEIEALVNLTLSEVNILATAQRDYSTALGAALESRMLTGEGVDFLRLPKTAEGYLLTDQSGAPPQILHPPYGHIPREDTISRKLFFDGRGIAELSVYSASLSERSLQSGRHLTDETLNAGDFGPPEVHYKVPLRGMPNSISTLELTFDIGSCRTKILRVGGHTDFVLNKEFAAGDTSIDMGPVTESPSAQLAGHIRAKDSAEQWSPDKIEGLSIEQALGIDDQLRQAARFSSGPFREGVEAIQRLLYDMLKTKGATLVHDVDVDFDPHYHEAVEVRGAGGHHRVFEVLSSGCVVKGTLVRPARVVVMASN